MEVCEKINALEVRIAFYEKTIDELNTVVYGQSKELAFLKQKIEQINEIIKSAGNSILKDLKDESPPPHY